MRTIELDAAAWQSCLDFYDALLKALGAPDWHGRSINALIDSMIYGGINQVEPPYRIVVRSLAGSGDEARECLVEAFGCLAEDGALFENEQGCATLTIASPR